MMDYKKLRFWQRAHALVLRCYEITATFPDHELYGLVSQIRRASVSGATNIVEGAGRSTAREFNRFLDIAKSSTQEVEYLFLVSRDLAYVDHQTWQEIDDECNHIKASIQRYQQKLMRTNGPHFASDESDEYPGYEPSQTP